MQRPATKIIYYILLLAGLYFLRCFFLRMMLLWCSGLLEMLIVLVTQVFIGVAIHDKSDNEPNEKHERHYDSHDHVPDLITQVHKDRDDIISFSKGKYTYHT